MYTWHIETVGGVPRITVETDSPEKHTQAYNAVSAILNNKTVDNNFPAADVEEVRHGKWLISDYDGVRGFVDGKLVYINPCYKCSVCGRKESEKEPYCHCGAKMDGKEGE